jgi:hypothetical protein
MKFIKLNVGWDAEPNAPMPTLEVFKHSAMVRLSFYLNSFIHDDVDEEDKGILEFINCYKYRIGFTNDEGFYSGQCRFSKTGVEWGNFYNIESSSWRKGFPNDEKIVDSKLENSTNLNHYLFYFRDETFECIAESYKFYIVRNDV